MDHWEQDIFRIPDSSLAYEALLIYIFRLSSYVRTQRKCTFVGVVTYVHTRECSHSCTCRDEIVRDEIHTLILSVECISAEICKTRKICDRFRKIFL